MISFRVSKALPLLALLAVLGGCSAQTGTSGPVDSTSNDPAQAVNVPVAEHSMHAGKHGRGQQSLLVTALRAPIGLTADQKTTIENAMKESSPKTGVRVDRTARAQSLATQIRAGKIEASAQAPNADAMNARIAARAKALDTLHATLTPAQRQALVDAISNRFDAKSQGTQANGSSNTHERIARKGGDNMRGQHRESGMFAELNLTQAQKDEIKSKMEALKPAKPSDADREAMKAKFQAMRAEMKTKLASFASDNFDAKAFVTPPADAMNKAHVDRRSARLAVVVSVLDAGQREQLASRIEQGPEMHKTHEQKTVEAKPGTAL